MSVICVFVTLCTLYINSRSENCYLVVHLRLQFDIYIHLNGGLLYISVVSKSIP